MYNAGYLPQIGCSVRIDKHVLEPVSTSHQTRAVFALAGKGGADNGPFLQHLQSNCCRLGSANLAQNEQYRFDNDEDRAAEWVASAGSSYKGWSTMLTFDNECVDKTDNGLSLQNGTGGAAQEDWGWASGSLSA